MLEVVNFMICKLYLTFQSTKVLFLDKLAGAHNGSKIQVKWGSRLLLPLLDRWRDVSLVIGPSLPGRHTTY